MSEFGIPGVRAPHTVAVVGAGIVGLATAKALESRGVRFDIFDQTAPGCGSFGGCSRAFRSYGPDPSMTGLLVESIHRWRDWETEMALPLYTRRGLVTLTFEEEMAGAEARYCQNERARLHEPSVSRLRELLPGFRCDSEQVPLFDPWGGVIWNRTALGALHGRLRERVIRRRIEAVHPLDDGKVRIRSGAMDRTYDTAVITAGSGARRLVSRLGLDCSPPGEAVLWTTRPVLPPYRNRQLVSLVGARYRGGFMYGFPAQSNGAYMVGFRTVPRDADGRLAPETIERAASDIDNWVSEALPGLDPAPTRLFASWGGDLPWGWKEPVGIRHQGRVYVPTGDGTPELAPVVGEALADVAEGKPLRPAFRLRDGEGGLDQRHAAAP